MVSRRETRIDRARLAKSARSMCHGTASPDPTPDVGIVKKDTAFGLCRLFLAEDVAIPEIKVMNLRARLQSIVCHDTLADRLHTWETESSVQ